MSREWGPEERYLNLDAFWLHPKPLPHGKHGRAKAEVHSDVSPNGGGGWADVRGMGPRRKVSKFSALWRRPKRSPHRQHGRVKEGGHSNVSSNGGGGWVDVQKIMPQRKASKFRCLLAASKAAASRPTWTSKRGGSTPMLNLDAKSGGSGMPPDGRPKDRQPASQLQGGGKEHLGAERRRKVPRRGWGASAAPNFGTLRCGLMPRGSAASSRRGFGASRPWRPPLPK